MNVASKQALLILILFVAVVLSAFSGLILITGFFIFAANLFAYYGIMLWVAILVASLIAGYGSIMHLKSME